MEYDLYSKVKLSRLPDLDPSSSTFFFLFWGPYRHQTSVTYIRKEGFSNKDFLLRTTFDFSSNLARCVLNCTRLVFEISFSNQLMKVRVELLDYYTSKTMYVSGLTFQNGLKFSIAVQNIFVLKYKKINKGKFREVHLKILLQKVLYSKSIFTKVLICKNILRIYYQYIHLSI